MFEGNWGSWSIAHIGIGFLVGFVFLVVDYKGIKKSIKGLRSKLPIKKNDRIRQMSLIAIDSVGEELFFRGVLLFWLNHYLGVISVFIVSVAFFLSHYLHWKAQHIFLLKSYLFQFILSIALGILFILTESLLVCIVAHIVFNFREMWVLLKRPTESNVHEKPLFNDYEV